MIILELSRKLSRAMVATVIASSVFITACGGSSGGSTQTAGIGGTGIVAGKTTGFGSIYVNGKKFETDKSQFIVDGNDSASQDDLALGMYVKLKVKTLDGKIVGEALEVVYDDEVQGPVSGISATGSGETQRTFTVFGQNVTIDETTTIFADTSFVGLSDNDVVEISGFRTSSSDITATYVEFKEVLDPGNSEVELRGTVTGYDPTPPESFGIVGFPGITFTTDGMTVKDLESGPLDDGLYVEVEGLYQNATTILAREIEEEDQGFGDDVDEVSLQGIISNWVDIDTNFEINGLPIDASGASLSPSGAASLLDDGVEVEVEGDIVGGVLIADELELREGETELRTSISAIDLPNNRFQVEYPTLGTVWVNTDGRTLFEDEAGGMPVENLSLDQLAIGNFVKVKGIAESGEVDAETVKRLDLDSSKLQGAVEAFNSNPSPDTSITILGITYPIDTNADYEDGFLTRTQFFATPLEIGDIVELEDDEPDADADKVEFDD